MGALYHEAKARRSSSTAPPPRQITRDRILELDGLRAFAILPVMLLHLSPISGPLAFLHTVTKFGWMGVDLFFVLSGFLITSILVRSVGDAHYYRDFVVRRTLRILPLYLACLAIFTAGAYFASEKTYWDAFMRWGGPLWFLSYMGNIRAALLNAHPPALGFVPLWSLQVEEQFYLLYPLLVAVCSFRMLRRVLVGCAVAALALRCVSVVLFPVSGDLGRFVLMPLRMDALALGGLVALARKAGTLESYKGPCRVAVILATMTTCGIAAVSGATQHSLLMSSIGYTVIAIGCASLLALVLMAGSRPGLGIRFLRWAPLVYTGQIAFGLYLLHSPAQWIARGLAARFVPCESGGTLHFFLGMLAAFAAAAASWEYFEKRILAQRHRFETPSSLIASRATAVIKLMP